MASWGATNVNIKANNTYRPPEARVTINEINLLPDPSFPTTPSTVLQQGGTGRKRVSWEGWVTSVDAYNALQDDKIAGTERTFTGPSGETLTGYIEFLQIIGYTVLDFLEYSIVIVEA